ncbi:hypothetical protein ACOT81_25040 [Streptomyces sp. WI04-05B]|uniref:hypothetical protein n=1 Tax=Streptomyces TaxID=1883 RepID=UPI0029B5B563|nr:MULTISPECIES: hypothetical protein [unclassified Streptomyces]MDX2548747.1 hypothetical protein [Streptomyces sp. WI04-05B]MDX2590424.1 hypothetical protein [Streptomyces sp. WI04-05A]
MNVWQPEADETLIARAPVTFATGEATPVSEMRWFRDTQRNDIQNELVDWPTGPAYTARSATDTAARNTAKGLVAAVGVAIRGFLSSHGGGIGNTPGLAGNGTDISHDHADEVDDFPVMWAAPGTIARTLPWQLDPARSSEKLYRTHAVITDRRLAIVGFPYVKGDDSLIDDELLWETPRSSIERVELRDFKFGRDAKIFFVDGSWCRLTSNKRERLTRYLIEPLDFIPLKSLTPAQRNTAEAFAAAQAPDAELPLVKRNPCGCLRIEVVALSTVDAFFGHSAIRTVMDESGAEVKPMERHKEDLLT